MYSAERQFVTTVHSQLCLLEQNELHPKLIFEDAIGVIKNASGPVKARAIYRAALLCEDVLKRCTTTSIKFQISLNRLKSLVKLYANGLYEVDPEFKSILLGENTFITSEIHPEISSKEMLAQLKAANRNAAILLQPLLHLVRDNKQANALAFLTGIENKTEARVTTTHRNASPHARSNIRFDTLIRPVTNRTLGEARALAKNVSFSYAADFETVDTSISENLQNLLQAVCLEIVRSGLVINGDLAASINRTWQISITGETRGQNLSISLSWPGEKLLGFGGSGNSEKLLQSLNGKLTTQSKQSTIDDKLDIHLLELTCSARKSEKPEPRYIGVERPQVREA